MPLYNNDSFGDKTSSLKSGLYNTPPDIGSGGPYPPPAESLLLDNSDDYLMDNDTTPFLDNGV